MKIKIALDQGVGKRKEEKLRQLGYDIVCVANHGEPDDSWMHRAFRNGANFVISPDMDIPKMIEVEKYPMFWVNYPSDDVALKKDLVLYVDKTIKFKMKALYKIINNSQYTIS